MPEKLDALVGSHVEERLLDPGRLGRILETTLERRSESAKGRLEHVAELNRRAAEADHRLKRLYAAIESGIADIDDPALKERVAALRARREEAQADAARANALAATSFERAVSQEMVCVLANLTRQQLRRPNGGYRRDFLRMLAQRVEVAERSIRIMGSQAGLLRALFARGGGNPQGGVPSTMQAWLPG